MLALKMLPLVDVKISSQKAKGPISLGANIVDMCIPSQIICDSDPKILHTVDMKHGSF